MLFFKPHDKFKSLSFGQCSRKLIFLNILWWCEGCVYIIVLGTFSFNMCKYWLKDILIVNNKKKIKGLNWKQ